MRPMILSALCLLAAGCAHAPQQQGSSSAQTNTGTTGSPNPGTMEMVKVESREETTKADSARNTAALPAQPIESSDQPLNTSQPLSTGQQPLVSPTSPSEQAANTNANKTSQSQEALAADTGAISPKPSLMSPSEIQLRERIQEKLATTNGLSYTARHVSVGIEKQDVTLSGDVRNAREKNEVQALVERVQGVRRVKNQLAVVNQTGARTDNTR